MKYLLHLQNTPFKRVKEDLVEIDPRLADNSFEAKVTCELFRCNRQMKLIKNYTFFFNMKELFVLSSHVSSFIFNYKIYFEFLKVDVCLLC